MRNYHRFARNFNPNLMGPVLDPRTYKNSNFLITVKTLPAANVDLHPTSSTRQGQAQDLQCRVGGSPWAWALWYTELVGVYICLCLCVLYGMPLLSLTESRHTHTNTHTHTPNKLLRYPHIQAEPTPSRANPRRLKLKVSISSGNRKLTAKMQYRVIICLKL